MPTTTPDPIPTLPPVTTDPEYSGHNQHNQGHTLAMVDTRGDASRGIFVDWKIIVGVIVALGGGGAIGTSIGHTQQVPPAIVDTLATKESVALLSSKLDDITRQLGIMALAQNTAAAKANSNDVQVADHETRLRAIEKRLR